MMARSVKDRYEKKLRPVYPVALTVAALLFLFGFSIVIQKLAEGWKQEYAALPVVHGFLLRIALWIRRWWWLMLGGSAAVCGLTVWVNERRRRKYGW